MKNKWPDTDAPDKTDKNLEFNNNMNLNGVPYHKVEVSEGKWQWAVNEEVERSQREYQQHRRDLYWACRSRVLTDAEMAEVVRWGSQICIEPCTPYNPTEKEKELNDALFQQFRMRAIVGKDSA